MAQYGSSSIGRADDRHRLLADDGDDPIIDTNGPLATAMSSSQRINPFNSPPPQTVHTPALGGAPAALPVAVLGLSSGGSEHMCVQTPRVDQRAGELEQITLEHDPLLPALVPMFQPLYSFILAFIFVDLLVLYTIFIWMLPRIFKQSNQTSVNTSVSSASIGVKTGAGVVGVPGLGLVATAVSASAAASDAAARSLCLCAFLVAIVSLLLDRALAYEHASRLRRRGFLVFYRRLAPLRRAPLHIASIFTGLVLVLVVACVWPRADASVWLPAPLGLAPVQLLQVFCTLEVVFIAPFWLTYCAYVLMFNQQRPLPDVDRHSPIINQLLQSGPFGAPGATFEGENVAMGAAGDSVRANGGAGAGARGASSSSRRVVCHCGLSALLERQAEQIRFHGEHNEALARRMNALSLELRRQQQHAADPLGHPHASDSATRSGLY